MAEIEQDSLEHDHDRKPEEQKTIQHDITQIFQELDFLKKKVSKLEKQLTETRDLFRLQQVCGVVEVPEL
jgi:predicted  nucleic acid-binding Zn-ribbon protein